ncbi:MAG: hypothetical protein IKF97_06225 [Clostridia bacterium]|nr:hypothetical protein [Clostridia bacterium]
MFFINKIYHKVKPMKNKILNNKGITLVALIITIIVLLILTSVATYSGIEAIENSKYTKFKSELKIMQTYINNWYEECKPSNENETFAENIAAKFTNIAGKGVNAKVATNDTQAETTLNNAGIVNNHDHYYLLQKEQKEALGVDNDGVTQDVLVSIIDRKVVSYLGMKYKDKMYYTLEDLDEFYNVEYNSSILNNDESKPSISTNASFQNDGTSYKIKVGISYNSSYVNKGNVYYGIQNENGEVTSWNNTSDDNFTVNKSGIYEIYFKDTAGNESNHVINYFRNEPNKPKIQTGMIPVKYDETRKEWVECEQTDKEWYDYENGKWANVKTTANGLTAYWVWIPRYEYIVPTSETATQIDTKFVYKEMATADEGYTIHPAFKFNNQELEGIWIAKFEPSSNAPNTVANGGGNSTTYKVQILPNATSWRNITIKNQFTICRNIQAAGGVCENIENINTHMIKNIEWGATAIFSQSKYGVFNPKSLTGKNGDRTYQVWNNPYNQNVNYAFDNSKENDIDTSIAVTNNDIIKTGCASSAADGKDATTTIQCDEYNVGNGPKASTTGTVYGIYDMAGGSIEFVAGCISGFENAKFGVTAGDNTYVDIYASRSNTDDAIAITGDATLETAGWNDDAHSFPYNNNSYAVFARSGRFNSDVRKPGIFNYGAANGSSTNSYNSFRPTLVVY